MEPGSAVAGLRPQPGENSLQSPSANPAAAENLVVLLDRSVEKHQDRPFLFEKRDGTYQSLSWRQFGDMTEALAAKLVDLGIQPGDRVAIIAENGPRWCVGDFAVLKAGGVSVPSYTTYTVEDYAFVLANAGVRAIICGGGSIARRVLPAAARLDGLLGLILLDPVDVPPDLDLPVTLSFDEALAAGHDLPPCPAGRARRPDDLACLIYTSGTGGRPKGVMTSHRNILANIKGVASLLAQLNIEELVFLSFLPLSHSYEHTVGLMVPVAFGAQIWYAEGVETLQTNFLEARPHILPCVPRLFEVFKQRLDQAMARQHGMRPRLFRATITLGTKAHRGRLLPHEWLANKALDLLVRRTIRARFGGRLAAMVSGGGALNPEIGLYFTALGLPVCQGYGQTESSPVVSVEPPWAAKLVSAGPPLEGVEVRIAEDGEILVRGDLVMQGYWQEPQLTAETVRDGWLHTGDIGLLDEDGYIRITDRKKDILVLSGGDNVAPQRVEAAIALSHDIGQVVVFGDRRPYLVALVVPSAELLKALERGDGQKVEARIGEAIKQANGRLTATERVRRWHVLAEPFTVENGLMTPTLKLRRALILDAHRPQVESLFQAERTRAA